MLKEALIALYRENPKWLSFPIYYLPFNEESVEVLGEAVEAFQEMEQLPWPDHKCVILTEEGYEYCTTKESQFLTTLVFDRSKPHPPLDVPENVDEVSRSGDLIWMATTHLSKDNKIRHIPLGYYVLQHIDMPTMYLHDAGQDGKIELVNGKHETVKMFPEQAMEEMWQIMETIKKGFAKNTADEFALDSNLTWKTLAERFEQYQNKIAPPRMKQFWSMIPTINSSNVEKSSISTRNSFLFAANILADLINIVMPCGHMVRMKFDDGFGCKSLRHIITGKPIFTFINYERLYQATVNDNANGDRTVSPHHRRGHIRYLWKKAGVNRLALPIRAKDRILLAKAKGVERVHVSPAWIGPTSLMVDGMLYDINIENRLLPSL